MTSEQLVLQGRCRQVCEAAIAELRKAIGLMLFCCCLTGLCCMKDRMMEPALCISPIVRRNDFESFSGNMR